MLDLEAVPSLLLLTVYQFLPLSLGLALWRVPPSRKAVGIEGWSPGEQRPDREVGTLFRQQHTQMARSKFGLQRWDGSVIRKAGGRAQDPARKEQGQGQRRGQGSRHSS